MRKIIYLISISLLFIAGTKAQVYTGVYLNNNYVMDNAVIWSYGAGYNFIIGYNFTRKISADLNVSSDAYSIYYFSGDRYKLNSYYLNFKYKISTEKGIKPYTSLGLGFFQKKTNLPVVDWNNPQPFYLSIDYTEKGIGIIPSIGFEFKHPSINNLNWDIGFSYKRIFTEHPVNLIQLKIGLLYYFNKKAS